jgi:hypothetical protein
MKVAKLVQQVSSERACLHVSLTLKFGKSPAAMPGQIRAAWNMCPKKEGYAMVTGRRCLITCVW